MNNENVFVFAKVRPQAKIPTKREEDGNFDLYICSDENEILFPPHTVKLVPTGIASAFSPKYRIAFRERGSNTKSNLKVSAGQIDSGFRGEYFVALHNDNDYPVVISKEVTEVEHHYIYEMHYVKVPYSKAVCQFAVEEVPIIEIKEITYDELKQIPSERGTGMLGSSNK